jgi:hypothetical protein
LANPETRVEKTAPKPKFGMRDLWRTAVWGLAAAGTMAVTLFAAISTETGRDRLLVAVAGVHEVLIPSGIKPIRPLDAREGRRLAETVSTLAADRERLLARIAMLEQSIDGVTGSIARVEQAVKAAPPPEPAVEAPQTFPPTAFLPEDVTSSITPPTGVPMPPSPPGSTANKTEFGLDLGGAATVEALRTAWTVALRRYGTLLTGLHAVVQTRERHRPGAVELRLIAGPIPNAATAARLCATMTVSGAVCAPAVFDGQRLAVR